MRVGIERNATAHVNAQVHAEQSSIQDHAENHFRFGFISVDSSTRYWFGIIDIFTAYTFSKQRERFIKTVLLRKDANGISVIPPLHYSNRFLRNLKRRISHIAN